MNFTLWLLNRIKRTIFPGEKWQWVSDYRNLILRDKGFSILVTLFGGLIWLMAAFVLSMTMLDNKEDVFFALKCAILSVPAFYVINWIMALYEIYNLEKLATWDALKRDAKEYS